MPELPEVETIVRGLRPELVGGTILSLELLDQRISRGSDPARLTEVCRNAKIEEINRRGKYAIFRLSGPRPELVAHLGMSGRLLLAGSVPEEKHLRAVFHIEGAKKLLFVDTRRFGNLFLSEGDVVPGGWRNLGVEPLSGEFTARRLKELIGQRRTAIKTLLLRQDLIAGIGNIYASEACHLAGIHPGRPGESLDSGEIRRLHQAIRRVLREAIEGMGTTFAEYRRPDGAEGEYGNRLKVYRRDGEPCPGCETSIERQVHNGRSTFFCPRCQH